MKCFRVPDAETLNFGVVAGDFPALDVVTEDQTEEYCDCRDGETQECGLGLYHISCDGGNAETGTVDI